MKLVMHTYVCMGCMKKSSSVPKNTDVQSSLMVLYSTLKRRIIHKIRHGRAAAMWSDAWKTKSRNMGVSE